MADPTLPSFDEDDLIRVRSRIYESMGDLDELPGALMAAARRLNAAHAALAVLTLDPERGYVDDSISTGVDISAVRAFARDSGTRDPWSEGLLASHSLRPGRILIGDQMRPRAEVLRSPWHSAVFVPNDCGDPLSAFVAAPAAHAGKIVSIVFWRSRRSLRYEPDAIDRLSLFVRDLERMVRIALALRAERREKALLAAALDRAAEPIFVLGADCTILFANAAAEAVLSRSAAFTALGMALVATNPASQNRLARAVARAVEKAEGSDFMVPRYGARPLMVTIAPTPGALPDRFDADGAALLAIVDPDGAHAGREGIAQAAE